MGYKIKGNMLFLLTGAMLAFIVDHSFFYMSYNKQHNIRVDTVAGRTSESTSSKQDVETGKAKVYRFNGRDLVRLHEFCTWTLHVDCVMLNTHPGRTPIHIHDTTVDKWVSGNIKKTGSWEPKNVQLILHQLDLDPDLGFMDLGAHVGAFSLSVAKSGRKVVSVDPLVENVQRLCKSNQKGGFTEQMTVIFSPLSDEHTVVNFKRLPTNLGGTVVVTPNETKVETDPCEENENSHTVTLDDLVPLLPFKKTVIKMDVEQYEYRVLKGGAQFFKEIYVSSILMEWKKIKVAPKRDDLIKLLLQYQFTPYEPIINGRKLNLTAPLQWPYDVMWKRS